MLRLVGVIMLFVWIPASAQAAVTYRIAGTFELWSGANVGLNGGRFEIRLQFDELSPPVETFASAVQNDARYAPLAQEIEIFDTAALNAVYAAFFSFANVQNTFEGTVAPDRFGFVHAPLSAALPTIGGRFVTIAGLSFDLPDASFFSGAGIPALPVLQSSDVSVTPSVSGEVPQFQVWNSQTPTSLSLYILRDVSLSTSVVPEPGSLVLWSLGSLSCLVIRFRGRRHGRQFRLMPPKQHRQ